jgi:pSer/pThr/pTyr-binding forkhead associated (FHA) protein
MPIYRLVMRSGPATGKIFLLEKAELFVGRDLNNDIVINDPEVSRRHARLFLQGSAYVVEDLGSTNGTFINGNRLAGAYPLRQGEVVTFGEHINMVYELEVADNEATILAGLGRPAEVPYQPPIPPQFEEEPEPEDERQTFTPPPVFNAYPVQRQPAQAAPEPDAYAGQVPYAFEPPKQNTRNRTLIIVAIVLLVVICLCVSVGLYFAPKEFWCIFPVWPEGACP